MDLVRLVENHHRLPADREAGSHEHRQSGDFRSLARHRIPDADAVGLVERRGERAAGSEREGRVEVHFRRVEPLFQFAGGRVERLHARVLQDDEQRLAIGAVARSEGGDVLRPSEAFHGFLGIERVEAQALAGNDDPGHIRGEGVFGEIGFGAVRANALAGAQIPQPNTGLLAVPDEPSAIGRVQELGGRRHGLGGGCAGGSRGPVQARQGSALFGRVARQVASVP